MYGCFYNMSTKNAESLEQGVEDILEYQATQSKLFCIGQILELIA